MHDKVRILVLSTLLLFVYVALAQCTPLFLEKWESGVIDPAKWKSWGSPAPVLVTGYGIGSWAIDLNGDNYWGSGVVSYASFDMTVSGRFLRFMARPHAGGEPPIGYGQYIQIGLSCVQAGDWPDDGSAPWESGVPVYIQIANAYDPPVFNVRVGPEHTAIPYDPALIHGVWRCYSIGINPDGTVTFWLDSSPIYVSTATIDPCLAHACIATEGRSVATTNLLDHITIEDAGPSYAEPASWGSIKALWR